MNVRRRQAKAEGGVGSGGLCPKGHFAAYTRDGHRLVIPISCLDAEVFRTLLEVAKEEFGVPTDGPIMLPCDAASAGRIMAMCRGSKGQRSSKNMLLNNC